MSQEQLSPVSDPSSAAAVLEREPGAIGRWAIGRIRRNLGEVPVRVRLADGLELALAKGTPIATVIVRDRRTLLRVLRNPGLNFGEAYMSGDVDVEGDLLALLLAVHGTRRTEDSNGRRLFARRNTLSAARDNVHHHYDLGNDFYRLWLDEQLVYTCAYFPTPDASLDAAQVAKMDLVARKLRLQPGERVVEAGCGWGALALHMAREYGASVRAFNISREQIRHARQRAAEEGLQGRVEFVEDDYRNITGTYDVFVSVGMLEHVGLPDYRTFGDVIHRSLPRGRGRGLLHFIGRNRPAAMNAWIAKRIFPGAYPPTLAEVGEGVLEAHDLSVLDVENLRLHYAKTLEHWRMRFERAADTVRQMFDDTFVRGWRLYLSGSQAAFLAGSLQLFQVVFARGESNDIPWTRGGLYRET
jgi:cyclopropane-fatty-acyl-phospholipid synthase